MIRILYEHDGGDRHTLTLDGHANGLTPEGRAICARVSAVFQMALLGLENLADEHPDEISYVEDAALAVADTD